MRRLMIGATVFGAATAVVPSHAAENLECIESGYTAAEQKVFDDFYAGFSMGKLDEDGSSDAHIGAISRRAGDCAERNDWQSDAIKQAILYRMSTMLAKALELKTPLTPEQLGRLDKALAEADQEKLRSILGPQIEAGMQGNEGPEMSDDDQVYLGLVVLGAGLPLDQTHSEYVGALLGARMMARIAAEKFAGF